MDIQVHLKSIADSLPLSMGASAITYDSCQFRVAEDTPVTVTNSTGVHFNNCYLRDGTAFDPLA